MGQELSVSASNFMCGSRIGQERRLARAACDCLVGVPTSLGVFTTTAPLLAVQGMLAPVWQRVILPDQQMQRAPPDARSRMALFVESEVAAE